MGWIANQMLIDWLSTLGRKGRRKKGAGQEEKEAADKKREDSSVQDRVSGRKEEQDERIR